MRTVLVALAIAGCSRAPGPAAPANKAPAPDYRATADDLLGFLPADSEFVFGVDLVQLRRSQLWLKFEPQIVQAIGGDLAKFKTSCGFDPLQTVERVTMAGNAHPGDRVTGVIVIRGVDGGRILDCINTEASKNGKVVKDRGVLVVTQPSQPNMEMAVTVVGPSTLVVQIETVANHDTLQKVLASGAPLRSSQAFMQLFARREGGASLWGMANGNSDAFKELASLGMRPRALDGTLAITDRFALAMRITMPNPDDAARVAGELDKIKGPFGAMVDRFETRADGDLVNVHVVVTEEQLRSLIGLMGGSLGP